MTAAGPGPDPGDRKDSIADEGYALAEQTSDPTPGPSARTGVSAPQAGPVGPCRSGRTLFEAGNTQSEMANADFLGCFGVANALEPPKPLRSSYTSLTLRPELPVFLPQTSDVRHRMDSLSDASSYDADSDESSDHAHERTAEDFYEVGDDFIEDFIRDLTVEEEEEPRPPIANDHVSREEFESMKLEYWRRFVEQSEETRQSVEKANALGAELLVHRSELQAATERFSRIASALQCSICLDTFAQPHSLACGHIFCEGCLLQWLQMSLKCPACRAHVPMRPAPAYAVKEVLALVSPQADSESSSAPAFRTGGDAADPWARLFPTHREPDAPGLDGDISRRMLAARAMRRQMAANDASVENNSEQLHERYRNRLSMLMARLIELTESRAELRQGSLPASPPIASTALAPSPDAHDGWVEFWPSAKPKDPNPPASGAPAYSPRAPNDWGSFGSIAWPECTSLCAISLASAHPNCAAGGNYCGHLNIVISHHHNDYHNDCGLWIVNEDPNSY
ncbi:E3 ubiquitin ligase [Coemansia sp. S610]|nr:E3 ubiquitin ligase [Coemansia sp. S610]